MPVDWGILAASTAIWAGKKLAGTAYKDKVEPILKKSGLDHELSGAYRAAFQAFVDVLGALFPRDDTLDARLHVMFEAEAFQEVLTELPRSRFEDVDTSAPLSGAWLWPWPVETRPTCPTSPSRSC